jgi:hypothetical protein
LEEKRKTALEASSLIIFTTLGLFALSNYIYKIIKVEAIELDIQNRTASDYTVEVPLVPAQVDALWWITLPE